MSYKRISAPRILRSFMISKRQYVLKVHGWSQGGWFTVEMCDENGRQWLDSYNRHALKEMRRKNRKLFDIKSAPRGW